MLATVLAAVAVNSSAQVRGDTRLENFMVSINGTSIKIDPVSGVKSDSISPSTPYPYSFKITNLAPYNDDFTLEIMNIPGNWTAIFTDTGTSKLDIYGISQNEQKVVNVIVSSSVYNTYNMTIKATSKISPEIKTDYILITCREDPIKISPDSTKKSAGAGSGVVYKVTIKNNYDQPFNVDLGLSAGMQASESALGDVWAFKFDQSAFIISNQATLTKNLTVFAPKNGTPNDEKVFLIEGTVDGDSRIYYSVEIKCVIKEVYNLTIGISPSTRTANPGDRLNYTITVRNNADNSDRVWIEVTPGDDPWYFDFSGDLTNQMEYFDIGAKQIKKVYVSLLVLSTAEAGTHVMPLDIRGRGGTDSFEIITVVNQTHIMELNYNQDEIIVQEKDKNQVYPVTLAPTTFRVLLKNEGNSVETAKIKVKDIGAGWQIFLTAVDSSRSTGNTTTPVNPSAPVDIDTQGVRYSFDQDVTEVTLNIERFFTVYLVLLVQAPSSAAASVHSFSLLVEFGSNTYLPPFIVNMTLSISNMAILDLDGDDQADIIVLNPNATNKPIEFQITIKNNYPLATNDFDVVLYVDNPDTGEVDRVNVPVIQPGEEKEIVLKWKKTESGVHFIFIKIKGQPIPTSNEPQAQTQINIGSSDSENTGAIVILIIIAVLILAIIVGTLIYIRMRSLGTSDDKESEEYDKVYGSKGRTKKEDLDGETEDYLHGAKYKSRKSKNDLEKDAKRLYGGEKKARKGGRRRGRRDEVDEEEIDDEPKKGPKSARRRGGRRGGREEDGDEDKPSRKKSGSRRKGKPRKGKSGKFDKDDDEDWL